MSGAADSSEASPEYQAMLAMMRRRDMPPAERHRWLTVPCTAKWSSRCRGHATLRDDEDPACAVCIGCWCDDGPDGFGLDQAGELKREANRRHERCDKSSSGT